jgi:uncharacterized protein with ParB-like and HNH nuclease domain
MATEIKAEEVTIGKLYSPDFMFEIPIFQRPLSWEKDNFDQLFEDIFEAMNNDEKQYFLGSIILQEHEKEKNKYSLVDGQQRISALAILMAVIRDSSTTSQKLRQKLTSYLYQEEDEYKGIPAEMRIIPWEELKDMFKKYIYEPGGTHKFLDDFENNLIKYNDTQDPRYHLYEAISVFREKLEGRLPNPADVENFVKYLLGQVYLVYIRTLGFASAYRLFNVLNTRGLPLNTSDLLKSENLGMIQDESIRLQYAKTWRDIENNLGREELENVMAFIRTIQIKEKAKYGIYDEYRRIIFEKGLLKRGIEFINYLKEIAEIYDDKILEAEILTNILGKNNEYKIIVSLLRRFVPFFDWIPPLIAFHQKFKSDKNLLDFILNLEKKVIIEWAVPFSLTERITSLNRIIKIIEKEKNPKNVIDGLLYYREDTERASKELDFSNKNQIWSVLKNRLNDTQFYSIHGGRFAKYILLRLDMECWELENFAGYPGTITVEHILPQTPSKDSEWVKNFTEEERTEWTNRIGNLVLLSGSKNSKAQNYDFIKKKDTYFKKKGTFFKITQYLEGRDKWTLEELKDRHQKLLDDSKKLFLNY